MRKSNFLEPCLWLAVDVQFTQGVITGPNAPELWRAVIKDGLLATRPDEAMQLLEPMRVRGLRTNVDCSGLVIECRDRPVGVRLFLKFLGKAYAYAPACLLALEARLRGGVGRQNVLGKVSGLQAWRSNGWVDISMPLSAAELDQWRADPAVLAGYVDTVLAQPEAGVVRLYTRTRWVRRRQGVLVAQAPSLVDVVGLIAQRVERFDLFWGSASSAVWAAPLDEAMRIAAGFQATEAIWRQAHRSVGGKYPGHGYFGSLGFDGKATDQLLYWLQVGSFLHIGQQTAIGQGGYEVMFETSSAKTGPPRFGHQSKK